MPQTAHVVYDGALHTRATHVQSGTEIETDAPTDNGGSGERFSPTDLVATALASCMATIMGQAAAARGVSIDGTEFSVQKIMAPAPRRIAEIVVDVQLPTGLEYPAEIRTVLERAAMTCPVFESLHPDMKKTVSFRWPGAQDT